MDGITFPLRGVFKGWSEEEKKEVGGKKGSREGRKE